VVNGGGGDDDDDLLDNQSSRKRVQQLKKRKKSCFLKSEKKRKKRRPTAYVQFHRPLNHSAFNTQLPKLKLSTCTGKSPTSHTLLRNADTSN